MFTQKLPTNFNLIVLLIIFSNATNYFKLKIHVPYLDPEPALEKGNTE